MTPREIEQLLGGYATDTLTEDERRILFEAALGNQELFDALASEQALKQLLEDPSSRAHLLAALGERREPSSFRLLDWLRRPSVLALAGAVATAIVVMVVVNSGRVEKPAATTTAEVRQPAPPQSPQPAASAPVESAKPPAPATRADSALRRQAPAAAPAKQDIAETDAKAKDKEESQVRLARNEPPPPPPPPAAAAAPAAQLQDQAVPNAPAQSFVAGGNTPPVAAAAPLPVAPARGQSELKSASGAGARDLYYARIGAVTNAMMDRVQPQKQARNKAAGGRVAPPGFAGAIGGLSAGGGAGAAGPAGIRYEILDRLADGSAREVNPAAGLAPASRIRIRFEANQEGDLAVLRREPDGSWTPWSSVHVRAGEPVLLPGDDFLTLPTPGALHFLVRFAKSLSTEALARKVTPPANLLREQAGNSIYVVNPLPGAPVEFEMTVGVQ